MRNHLPGYCRHAYDRLRIDTEGRVAPCPFATDRELELGNLADKSLDEMWNGARMRDLRRAHYTWDYPTICKSCRCKESPPPREHLPFVWDFLASLGLPGTDVECSVTSLTPGHMTRVTEPPVLSFARTRPEIDRLFMILALGGEAEEFRVCDLDGSAGEGDALEFAIPRRRTGDPVRPRKRRTRRGGARA